VLSVLSIKAHVAPASLEMRNPTPPFAAVAVAGGDDHDRLVRVIVAAEDGDPADVDPEGRAEVGDRDVGRAGAVGGQEVVRLPDAAGGAGDRRRCFPTGRTGRSPGRQYGPSLLPPIDAGPTEVQVLLDRGLVGSIVKMRKPNCGRSATGSPRSVPGVGFCKVIDQLLSVPMLVAELFVIWSVYTPVPVPSGPVTDENPVSTPSGCCGLNRPKNGGPPLVIGVVALSSKMVVVKF